MENRPTIILYPYPHTIVEESALESVLESADYSSKSADSNVYSPRIDVWVRALIGIYGNTGDLLCFG